MTPVEQDAYVWQRQWSAPVREAVTQSADLVAHWRVLAAQLDAQGRWVDVHYDRDALRASGKPVILVVRIDGQLAQWHADDVAGHVQALIQQASGLPVTGIEIDHDCATSRLDDYAALLASLRQRLPANLSLSITALPTWMGAPALPAVLAHADDVVLQVHAVQSPRAGLFDAKLARAWIDRFASLAPRGFHVALPAYGTRVAWGDDGRPRSVESEARSLDSAEDAHELAATPEQVAGLLSDLRRHPPPGWRGVAWFRLPTSQDARAWSPATWRAVVTGRALSAKFSVQWSRNMASGAFDVVLSNDSVIDASLPDLVSLPSQCVLADGINGYVLDASARVLRREREGWLRGQHKRVIGWVRCPEGVAPPQGSAIDGH